METNKISDVVQCVQGWPAPMRVELARQILETLETSNASASAVPRGPSAAEVAARFATGRSAPDDQTMMQWIDEHRLKKYGQFCWLVD